MMKKLLVLAAKVGFAWMTPGKLDDAAVALELITSGTSLLQLSRDKKANRAAQLNETATDLYEQARKLTRQSFHNGDLLERINQGVPELGGK